MAEARKCDRCHGFYELSAEDQKNHDYPYDMKGSYIKILVLDRYGERENSTRWYDLCPKCMELLDKWLENPDNIEILKKYDTRNLAKDLDDAIYALPSSYREEGEYQDPCKTCNLLRAVPCEQCVYGQWSEEEKKKRWWENHKKEVKLSDPYEEGGL